MTWDGEVTKSTDESVSSSVTMQDDDELFFTTTSGAVYRIQLVVIYASPAGAGTPDIKVSVGEDTTVRGSFRVHGMSFSDAAVVGILPASLSFITTGGTAAADRALWLDGIYNGNGGTFKAQWAQRTSDANATIVRAGSWLGYRVVA